MHGGTSNCEVNLSKALTFFQTSPLPLTIKQEWSFSFNYLNCLLEQTSCYLHLIDLIFFFWLHLKFFSFFCVIFNYLLYDEIPVNSTNSQSLNIGMGQNMNQSFQITFVLQVLRLIMLWSTSHIWICAFETLVGVFLKAKCSVLREVTAAGLCADWLLTLSASRCVIFN